MNAGVLCTEAFHSSLRDVHVQSWIKMEPAGTVMLKGKQTETALYAVKQTERPANPFEKSHTTELVGRSGELQQLTHFITNSFNDANSAPRMMVIEGIVGMGKTALLGCVNDMLRKDSSGLPNNLRVLNLKCTSNDRPFQTCQQILQTVFNLSGVRNAAQFSYLEVTWAVAIFTRPFPCLPDTLPNVLRCCASHRRPTKCGDRIQGIFPASSSLFRRSVPTDGTGTRTTE